jgi:glycosyltransferase involved in cell wall biosynthesis
METTTAPKQIAIYMHTLYNGGVERVMFDLIRGFLDRGIAVDLVLDHLIYSPFEKILPEGVNLVKLGAHSPLQRIGKLRDYLATRRPHAMLSATHFANETACVARYLAKVDTRLLLSEHTTLSSDIANSSPRSLRTMVIRWTTRRIYPMADAIIAVSNGVADDMCKVSGLARDKVLTIYNPIDATRLFASAAEPLADPELAPWFTPGAPPVLLAIGRLETQKNFPNLLRAFAKIRAGREAKLLILGEGSERAHLTALIAELGLTADVAMPGFVPNPAAYMARSAVFVMSSNWEGMPVAQMEALTLGTPVVSTDCPSGPAEILANGAYGEMVPMNDSDALAEAIERVFAGARKTIPPAALERFNADAITERYLSLMFPA